MDVGFKVSREDRLVEVGKLSREGRFDPCS
jgi:hypothetical protein